MPSRLRRRAAAPDPKRSSWCSARCRKLTDGWEPTTTVRGRRATGLETWLDVATEHLGPEDEQITEAVQTVRAAVQRAAQVVEAFDALEGHIPFFVYFSQYVKVQPRIHLGRLARPGSGRRHRRGVRLRQPVPAALLGLSARELSDLGRGIPMYAPRPAS